MVEEVLSRVKQFNKIYEILGISREEYDELFHKHSTELRKILKTGSFVGASIRLLKWFGFRDEEISLDKLMKAIVVLKVLVHHINK